MIRISIPFVYNLHESLVPLGNMKPDDMVGDHLYALFTAEHLLTQFLQESLWGRHLRVSQQPGQLLIKRIQEVYTEKTDLNAPFESWRVLQMQQQLSSFKAILEAEFLTTASFLVTSRRGFDIASLIENAEVIFPPELVMKVPDTLFDLQQAGRCIAFDLGTAAGFHLLRALETVIRAYWNVVMEGKALPDNRNIGNYLREMEKAGKGNAKCLTSLRNIKDHHRNELMHPEEKLDLDQAIGLLGIVQSAMVTMLKQIPDPPAALPELAEAAEARE